MSSRMFLFGAAAILALGVGAVTAQAASEEEIGRLHAACSHGDREACGRFQATLRDNHQHEGEWRRTHAEWYR